MIKYNLICRHDHEFEAWFSSSKDYDAQREKRLVQCPHCGSAKVEKAIMAPNVSTSRKKAAAQTKRKEALAMMNAAAQTIRKEIEDKCDYVGEKFADEARAIHYGEKEERPIYGEASAKEAEELRDEGVGIAPLPDVLAPKPKKKVN
ncbi:DUF1178 family protein [Hellea balneolensis]|uniref:DUF1178 family protein n=1 Tax=Hellea balneolensis TaxID=287478 RepID=UPI00040E03E4|nr:DUF1178 family protein [Hellea balneolensis]